MQELCRTFNECSVSSRIDGCIVLDRIPVPEFRVLRPNPDPAGRRIAHDQAVASLSRT
jgi:hypothetical protein